MKRILKPAAMVMSLLLAGCFSQAPVNTVDRSSPVQSRSSTPVTVPQVGPGFYLVKRGDTLYRIALDHGLDHRELATWNNISNPSALREGQTLRIAPPEGSVATPIASSSGIESRPLDQAPSAVLSSGVSGVFKQEPRVGKEPYSDEAYARLSRPEAAKVPEAKPADVKMDAKPETKPVSAPDDVSWLWPSPSKVTAPFSDSGNKGFDFAGKAGDPVLAAGDGKVVYAGSGLRGYGELVIIKHNATYLSAYGHNRKILVKEGQQVSRGQKIAEMGSTDTDSVKLHFEIRKLGKPVDPAGYLPKR